jgi:hypothetical protein
MNSQSEDRRESHFISVIAGAVNFVGILWVFLFALPCLEMVVDYQQSRFESVAKYILLPLSILLGTVTVLPPGAGIRTYIVSMSIFYSIWIVTAALSMAIVVLVVDVGDISEGVEQG